MSKESIIEKAYKIGDEKDFKGITYYVADFNAAGQPKWRKKNVGSAKQKTSVSNNNKGGGKPKQTTTPKKNLSDYTPNELVDFANQASTSSLEKIVNDKKQDQDIRQIAFNVLKKRGDYDKTKVDSSDLSGGNVAKPTPKVKYKTKSYDNYKTKKPDVPIRIGKFTIRKKNGSQEDITYEQQKAKYNKFDDDHIIKFVNAQNMAPESRQVAFDIAYERGIPEDKLNVDGTLKKFWDNQKRLQNDINTNSNDDDDDDETQWQSVDTGLDNFKDVTGQTVEEFMSQFPEGDMGWMSQEDDRVKKAFRNLKTPSDRRLYDNFVDAEKRKNPKYVNQKMQLNRLRKSYFSFLSPYSNAPMLVSAGGAGVGKTWNFNHIAQDYCGMVKWDSDKAKKAEEAGQEYTDFDYIVAPQINSVPKLCKFLSKYKDKVVVFDDNDALLTDNEMCNIMKTLCDGTKSNRYFAEYDDKGKATGKNTVFKGKIVVMTNKSSDQLLRNPDARAVMSRADRNEVSFTINENIEALTDRYMKMDCNIKIPSYDDAQEKQLRQDIFDYIVDNKDKLDPRGFTVRKFAELYKKAASEINAAEAAKQSASAAEDLEPEDWRDSGLDILNKADENYVLSTNLAFYDPEDDLSEEERKRYANIFRRIDSDDWEFKETSEDEKEDKINDKNKSSKKKIKKSFDADLGMSLSEAEDILLG